MLTALIPASFIAFAATVVAVLQSHSTNIWKDAIADPGPWCEHDHADSFLREPANAGSDFAYLLVAAYFLYQFLEVASQPSLNLPTTTLARTKPELYFALAVIHALHATGSFLNHACRCHRGHVYDVFGMYLAVFSLVALFFARTSVGSSFNHVAAIWTGCMVTSAIVFWPLSQYFYSDPLCHPTENACVTSMVVAMAIAHGVHWHRHRHKNESWPKRWTFIDGGAIRIPYCKVMLSGM
eukprot:TRINITY_DN6512_c0_g1_i3.p1 TRINITY_DN6512_c0_g1~~TRINITY_DN6512_c0_g1_i3.p1  ORF type:complete len:239 (+),score=28.24 TRINITY_DN6512_c0_g1_i3:9-725(+)